MVQVAWHLCDSSGKLRQEQNTNNRSHFLQQQIIYLRATGGEVGASSALAPKIGPLGLVSFFAALTMSDSSVPLTN